MITYLLESTFIWLVFLAFYQLFLQKETFFKVNRLYLLLALLAGLVLPLINIPLSTNAFESFSTVSLEELIVGENTPVSLGSESLQTSVNWMSILFWVIYSTGSVIFVRTLILNLKSIRSIYVKGVKSRNKNFIEINMNDDWNPFSFFKWMFIPGAIKQSPDYPIIREHEIAHIRQWHSLDILFLEVIRIVFWFNPLLNGYKKAIVQNHEYLADESILRNMDRYRYGNLLLSFNTVHPALFLGNRLNNSIIKNRITMMYKNRSKRNKHWKYFLLVPVFSLLFFFFSCENNAPVQNNSEDLEKEEITDLKTDTFDVVFKVVEQMPRFPGCESVEGSEQDIQTCSHKELMTYLFTNLKYPESARQKGTEGTIIAQFVVNKAGMVEEAKIVKDIGDGCGEAVLDVISSMNTMDKRWTPGKQGGENVKVMYSLPVKFKLENDTEK